MVKPIGSLAIAAVVPLLAALCLVSCTGGDARWCAPVPSMTVEQACDAVCGTAHMLKLCLRTLQPRARRGGGEHRRRRDDAVTRYVGAAARGALDAYAATAAAKRGMQYSAALPAEERTAHERCMAGYDLAVRFMGRVAGDLASCETAAARLRDDCDGSLAGMDACRRKLFGYPASPLIHHISCLIRTDLEGVPDKERQLEFYMETTSTTRIVSILISLVLLEQGDTYGYKYKPPRRRGERQSTPNTIDIEATTYKPTYAKTSRRISTSEIRLDRPYPVPSEAGRRDLALSLIPSGRELEEEGYPVVDYESDLQTAMSTTVR
uniref:Pectinesterase inhibitor domain-containing protein n=1 Tax=Oryza sativa subsp. japonica TaxID=39947 RepID=Q6YYZ3_ORYSJ|nr:hypothetical protein [Oryza sativa Japonica Group]BAD17021.1 hypothetical protein [Oryza sativa Japonica Group]